MSGRGTLPCTRSVAKPSKPSNRMDDRAARELPRLTRAEMKSLDPLGQPDHYRSETRRRVTDQLLGQLVDVATGARGDADRVRVAVRVDGPEHAHDLAYAAAWLHDEAGRWLPGTHHDPARLLHSVEVRVENITGDGFDAVLAFRGTA